MGHRVALIPGDGAGPELTAAARRVMDATGVGLHWEPCEVGEGAYRQCGEALPASVVDVIRASGVALKGPVATPIDADYRSVNIELRRSLDLFAQARLCRIFPGVPAVAAALDLVVIRETTEDLYSGIEFGAGEPATRELIDWVRKHGHADLSPESAISLKPLSEAAALRVFRFAFEYARTQGRRRVTAVHKATVMRRTDGLFVEAGQTIAREFPDISFDALAVDALALKLVRRPEEFDVLVAPNLYGDILADLAAGLAGGIGLVPGANVGEHIGVFEAAHGTVPRQAGRNTANPLGLILSGALLLRHLGETGAAARIESAVRAVVGAGECVTADLRAPGDPRPPATTSAVVDAIVEELAGAGR
jgi:isocitrate dehydrogenase (NAD+)